MMLVVCILLITQSFSLCSGDDKEFYVTFHPHLDAFWLNYDN